MERRRYRKLRVGCEEQTPIIKTEQNTINWKRDQTGGRYAGKARGKEKGEIYLLVRVRLARRSGVIIRTTNHSEHLGIDLRGVCVFGCLVTQFGMFKAFSLHQMIGPMGPSVAKR